MDERRLRTQRRVMPRWAAARRSPATARWDRCRGEARRLLERAMLGIVLTAGGARGAYQAGVLQRIGEIPALRGRRSPFRIVAGASAGAINGSTLAAFADDLTHGTQHLARLWSRITVGDVFRSDLLSLAWNGARLVGDLALGGVIGGGRVQAFLDASPLRRYLAAQLPLAGVAASIARGDLYALAVTATSYHSGRSFTFIQGRPGHPLWMKSRRVTLAVEVGIEHVCASASIPIVFPPVLVTEEVRRRWAWVGGRRRCRRVLSAAQADVRERRFYQLRAKRRLVRPIGPCPGGTGGT